MTPAFRRLFLLLALALACVPQLASAYCSFDNGTSWSRVIFNTPSQITVPNDAAPQTVLWTSPMVAPDSRTDVYCNSYTTGGIVNYLGTQPASGETIFPTNVPGLGIRLARGSATNYLVAASADYLGGGTTTFSKSTSLELVVIGDIPNGSTLYAGQLVHWDFGNLGTVQVFQTAGPTTFVRPACSIAIDPTEVTLAGIATGSLSGNGSTAGDTPFSIQLNCSSAATLAITLDANNPVNGQNGVLRISSGQGNARGVGVQITRNGNPVALGTAVQVTSTSGPFAIPFSARYYRTGGILRAGAVRATATYTLTYP